ncbi:MAG: hypothetical protein OER86_12790, partial [Phycisphaerae bacterium]|nr:hypothetical protein [Phycisphaerae bacterium]
MPRPLFLCVYVASATLLIGGCRGGADAELPGIDDLLAGLMPETPAQVARDLFNMHDADRRRRAINLLSTAPFGGEPPYVKAYRELVTDPDRTVRAACLRALG